MLNPADYIDESHPWFESKLSRSGLKPFLQRNNHRAVGHFTLWLALLAGFGTLASILFLQGSWWSVPVFLIYGIIYSGNNARWHECSHGTCFKNDSLNRFFYWLCGSMELRDGIEFRWSHARHHSYTMFRVIDPEIPLPRPPNLIKYFADYFYLWSGFYALRNLVLHSVGIVSQGVRNYVPQEEFPGMFRSARAALLPHLVAIATSILLRSWLPVLLFGLPRFYGCFVQWAFNGMQHAGMAENEYDHRVSTRSFLFNPVLNFLYINMGHHIEHHLYPLVPWHQLPKLHERIKTELPPAYEGLSPAFRELFPALKAQRKDTGYNIQRPLPRTESEEHNSTASAVAVEDSGDWIRVGNAAQIARDEMILVRADDRHIVVYSVDGGFCATDGLCTHEQAPLINGHLDGNVIECPKHNARFHICSGKVLRPPAKQDLKSYPVKVKDGSVFIALGESQINPGDT